MNTLKTQAWIVVTDLDGTLLDHHTYSFEAAKATLEKLRLHNVPVIINSSKTAAEIKDIKNDLANEHPFIVENGSGILIPKSYFSFQPEGTDSQENYWEMILGCPRSQILKKLDTLNTEYKNHYKSFSQSSVHEIMELTGLKEEEAKSSMIRAYTEPLLWTGDDDLKKQFFGQLYKQRIHFTEGGRFIHLMGHTNKGSATAWLAKQYEKQSGVPVKIVALGDGKNDIDMLKMADIAVVVKSPTNKPPEFNHSHKIMTDQTSPEGWSDAIETLFFKQTEPEH